MTIWIDGDGCPKGAVRSTLDEGARRGIKVVLVTNIHHETKAEHRIIVDGSAQAVDLAIANRMQKGDVVITQDIGLSALVLSRQGYALSPAGQEYKSEDMGLILELREAAAKHRRGGGRTKGPKKRTQQDEESFLRGLRDLLDRIQTTTDHG